MDIASLAGILLALFMLVFGIISSAGVGGFREYLDPASAIITFGGAFSCTLTSVSLQNYIAGLKSFTLIFKAPTLNTSDMIGTLIGLVDMLYHMDDPSTLGPAMAVALITTLYGSLLANWICTPVSNKLKADNAIEMQQKEVMIEGLLSIQAGENPRVIEEKLKSFLPPKDRTSADEEGEAGGEA